MNQIKGPRADSHLNQLTGLRFAAAFAVYLYHFPIPALPEALSVVKGYGFVGVSVFFMLSGFVLSHSYSNRVRQRKVGFPEFFLYRVIRIVPLHLATAIPFILWAFYQTNFDPSKVTANLLLLHAWIPNSDFNFSLNAASWSLSNEIFFYLVAFPIFFLTFGKLRGLLSSAIGIVVISAIVMVTFSLGQGVVVGEATPSHWLFYIFPLFRLVDFLGGVVLQRIVSRGQPLRFIPSPVISYMFLLICLLSAPLVPKEFSYSLFFLPSVFLLLASHICAPADRGLNRFLSSKPMRLLGEASYAFYLTHLPITGALLLYLDFASLPNTLLLFIVAIFLGGLSILIERLFDAPIRRKLRLMVRRRL